MTTRQLHAARLLWWFTCITFVGVELHLRGALWAGAGVTARPEEAEVAAHVLTRVQH